MQINLWRHLNIILRVDNNSKQLTCSIIRETRHPPTWSSRFVFEKRRQFTEFAEGSKWGNRSRLDAGKFRILSTYDNHLRDHPRCFLLCLGCGGRNVHDTKRAETLSRNRNEVWSFQSALPEKREEGREESREKQREVRMRRDCIAELDDWIVRERGSTRSPVPDISRNAAEFSRDSSGLMFKWHIFIFFFFLFLRISNFRTRENFDN